jgi:hypothetical protein
MKRTPKGYRFLQKVFALPSRKVLTELLHRIPFNEGINEEIIKTLADSARKIKPHDLYCSLIFDEMSLAPHLSHDKKKDAIRGFVNGRATPTFADHATVFMLRGLHRKWKQPVSYFFVQASMTAAELCKNLKIVIRRVLEAGFKVVTTVCDQNATNVSAINMLKTESMNDFKRQGLEYRSMGFFVEGCKVIPLYDPPHLLKGVRNNLLDSYAHFHWKGKKSKASWEHIIQLYEMDAACTESEFKLLHKLTDTHVYSKKLKKMKVGVAAQVLSQRVASTMKFLASRGEFPFNVFIY